MSERVVLSPERHKLMISLKAAAAIKGDEWVNVSDVSKRVLNGLETLDFITVNQIDGKTMARITGRGNVGLRVAIVHGSPEYVKLRNQKRKAAAPSDDVIPPMDSPEIDSVVLPNEAPIPAVQKAEDCEPRCAAPCAHHRVLEMLMERNPKVRDLLESAIRLEKLLEGFDAQ